MLGRIFLGRYQALRLLGEGGMGRVYLARQLDLGRQVVVKVMHDHIAADPKFCERFQRETLLMARFQHPAAVTLYDASLNDPQGPCIVMEYIRGMSLDQLLEKNNGRLSPARVGRLLVQLCEVLHAAHSNGIIHRDLKPANLMVVDPDTPYEKIKVMDFGLAKLIDQPTLQQVSITGQDFAVGTPTYICPEQVRGEPTDHRGDLYSVGVILYEMLTGQPPFMGNSTMDILLAHATETPKPFEQVGAANRVPEAIETLVLSCLAKDPNHRPASARELAELFETALAHQEVVQEETAAKLAQLPPPPTPDQVVAPKKKSPEAVIHYLDAWMPESVAIHKLRGFMHDKGGEVVESVPGSIRVRLGGPGSAYRLPSGRLSWLGLGRKPSQIEMELRMQHTDPLRPNLLNITVLMHPPSLEPQGEQLWREICTQVYVDLRAYLMGHTGSMDDSVKEVPLE